jgi:diguanylate cyclase (GGDEF)-like protein
MDVRELGPGIALIVQPDGRIAEALRLPPNSLIGPGVPFDAIMEPASRSKSELFLEEVRRSGAVFGWEMTCYIEDRPREYLFTGLRLENRFLVLCALHQEGLFRLFEEMIAVTDVRPDIWRAALRQLAETLAQRSDARAAEVEELTRLNNELDALQKELTRKNAELEALNVEIQRLAETDALTGLLNRRGFFFAAERDFLRARRYGQVFAIIMIDIDHFKAINDRWGHRVGDQALAGLAAILKKTVRDSDLLARYGGEEFILIAVNDDASQAEPATERIRKAVEAAEIPSDAGPLRLTVSLGVGAFETESSSLDEVIGQADQALYLAKNSGRNRVELFRK